MNEKDVDVMSIKSMFMKSIVSMYLSKQLKKNISSSCVLDLNTLNIQQTDGRIIIDGNAHFEMTSSDFRKLLLKKNLI